MDLDAPEGSRPPVQIHSSEIHETEENSRVRVQFHRSSNNLEGYRRQTRKADGEKCNDDRLRLIRKFILI